MLFNKKITSLKVGDILYFNTEHRYIRANRGSHTLYWENGEDKKIFPFINNEDQFILFAEGIADAVGLGLKVEPPTSHGPRYSLVQK
jgi:hypothetical protein